MKRNKKNRYHALSADEIFTKLKTSISGLSSAEASRRRKTDGENVLPEKSGVHPIVLLIKQFNNVLIYILLVAAAISFFFGHKIDSYVILVVVLLNAVMGFVQEYRAGRAIEALKKVVVFHAKVYRDGKLVQIPSEELVVGDYVFLEEGARIPADIRLIETRNFQTVESSLTGDSLPVSKNSEKISGNVSTADIKNCVWMGTHVSRGQAKGIVFAVGRQTAFGEIAGALEDIKIGKSHFQKKADVLGKQMGIIAVTTASLIFLVGYFVRDFDFFELFLFTVASLVSGIPAGLPAILVVVLALGAWRMAKHKAIVRSLTAVETLGIVDVIITDKTGTLTQNTMTVEQVVLPKGETVTVSGDGWSSDGEFFMKGQKITPSQDVDFAKMIHVAGLCTTVRVYKKTNETSYNVVGDPTEAALVVLAKKAGLERDPVFSAGKIVTEEGFNSEYKARGTLVEIAGSDREKKHKKELYIAGAPEEIIARSKFYTSNGEKFVLDDKTRERISRGVLDMSSKALRAIALAHKTTADDNNNFSFAEADGLILDGIVGMKDPVRPEVPQAIRKAKGAGIRIIMATGDHKATAFAVAEEVGLEMNSKEVDSAVLTEKEIENLSEADFEKAVQEVSIFARLSPKTKLRLAKILKGQGHTIAMTGDGINDAPVLKQADVGIAMGNIGTDVAREASQVVLTDDNFATIVSAIEEGRVVFVNTRQAGSFLVTTNFAEHGTILSTLALGLPLPLLPIQILWLNLVTDGVSGVPLAAEPSHHDVLSSPPRHKKENILAAEIIPFLVLMVIIMASLTLLVFSFFLEDSIEKARTGAFAVMTFTQLFNVLNMRSLRRSVFSIGLFSNRYIVVGLVVSLVLQILVFYTSFFQNIFQFLPLTLFEFVGIILLSSLVLWFGELYKFIYSRQTKT